MVKKIKILTLALLSTLLTSAQCENDTINPWFVNFEYEITIQCGSFVNNAIPIIDDDCDEDVEIAMLEDTILGDCDGTQTIYRIYRAHDDAGNQVVESQIIYVVDEVPPTIIGERHIEVQPEINIATSVFASVFDNCSSATLTHIDVEVSGNNIIRVYTAIDDCGNTSTFEQIISFIPNDEDDDEDEDEDEDNEDEDEDDDCEDDEDNNSDRVAICHHLGNGGWITIYVAQQAVHAHLNHGDYLGPCNEIDQILPYTLEKLPNGEVKKYMRCK